MIEAMGAAFPKRRFLISRESRPAFARYARLHQDRVRGRRVILAPERAYEVDPVGEAVLALCDGELTVGEIVEHLASIYSAPVDIIANDVGKMLQGLADKRLLRDGPDSRAPASLSPAARSYPYSPGGPAGLLAELTRN